MGSYLEIPIASAQADLNVTSKLVIDKSDIIRIAQGSTAGGLTPGTLTTIWCKESVEYQLTHTAAAAGFSVLDSLIDAWTALPGNGVSKVGRIEKPGTILVNKDITNHKKLANVINHENIHIGQLKRGDLDWDEENVYWKDKKIKRSSIKEGSPALAWEKEAYSK